MYMSSNHGSLLSEMIKTEGKGRPSVLADMVVVWEGVKAGVSTTHSNAESNGV